MNHKEIYIFTDWYYPGYKAGGPIQSVYNLAQYLSRTHSVRIITRNTDYGSNIAYENTKANEWIEIAENHFVYYISIDKLGLGTIKKFIKKNNNIILINGIFSFYFSILPLFYTLLFRSYKVLVATRGMLHSSALSIKPLKKQMYLAFARGFGLFQHCTFLASNDAEKTEILNSLPYAKIKLLPNIPIKPMPPENALNITQKDGIFSLLYLGRIAPEKNPITLVKALALIPSNIHVHWVFTGIDKSYFAQWQTELNNLPKNIINHLHGEVPHAQLPLIFDKISISVLPSLGENFGHAIFESLSYGIPVIIGNNTPWQNLDSKQAGFSIEPTNFKLLAEKIQFFKNMPLSEYSQWKEGAYNLAVEYYQNISINKELFESN